MHTSVRDLILVLLAEKNANFLQWKLEHILLKKLLKNLTG